MTISDLNVMSFLKGKMRWHQARQRVLADNVANADTPHYKPSDLRGLNYQEMVQANQKREFLTVQTHGKHFSSKVVTGQGKYDSETGEGFEIRPAGNAVVLEEQMMNVTQNQFDFRMVSSLYSKSLGLLKTAIGRGA